MVAVEDRNILETLVVLAEELVVLVQVLILVHLEHLDKVTLAEMILHNLDMALLEEVGVRVLLDWRLLAHNQVMVGRE